MEITALPDEIIHHILNFIKFKELCKVKWVCSRWNSLITEKMLTDKMNTVNGREMYTNLKYAIKNGCVKTIQFMLQFVNNIDMKDSMNMTLVMYAARYGQLKSLKLLKDKGASMEYKCLYGRTPLHYAALYDHLDIAQFLIENYPHMKESMALNDYKSTPLHLAAKKDSLRVLKLLLDSGVQKDKCDSYRSTALDISVGRLNFNTTDALFEYGAGDCENIFLLHPKNCNPLEENIIKMTRYLLKRGKYVNFSLYEMKTPLHFDIGLELASLCVKNGLKVDALCRKRRTPLHEAVIYGNADMVKFLLENGANVHATDKNNNTPLHYATENYKNDDQSIISILISNGANMYVLNSSGNTPMQISILKGFLMNIELL